MKVKLEDKHSSRPLGVEVVQTFGHYPDYRIRDVLRLIYIW